MSPRAKSAPKSADDGGKSAAKPAKKAPARPRKVKAAAGSIGLTAVECGEGAHSEAISTLEARVVAAGGRVLSTYREPLGGHWVTLAALPLDRVAPTPYQRELSKAHADKLAVVIPKVGRFLDPIIAIATEDVLGDGDASGVAFITPNGMHRLTALKSLGARTITALLVPEREVAFRILALNTEKAHTLRDKALEVIRMARALAADARTRDRAEADFAFEFEQPSLLTLGICYERNGRFSGGAYQPVLVRCEDFAPASIATALEDRAARADKVMALDEAVVAAVAKLKDAGWQSGYLKPIVVARINPLRFAKSGPDVARPDFDRTLDKMIASAQAFDASKVKAQDIALAASVGGSSGEE